MNKVEKIREEIKKRYEYWKEKESNSHSIESESRMSECQHLLLLFNSLQEDPISNDLEEAAHYYVDTTIEWFDSENNPCCYPAFIAGAQWQKANLWKDAQSDDLPEVDREVIALVEENEHYKVVFAHRPPEYWDGKNIITNEVTRYEPKRYDKGGWNQPNVKWWLDLDLPKMQE